MVMVNADTRAERLLTAADDAARLVRRVYITFLLLCAAVAVIIWSTTDEHFVRGSPLTLPQVNISPSIDAVYGVVPWVILVFHFNLLLLLMILAQKLRRLETAYSHLPFTVIERQDFYVRQFPFPFSHMILGVIRPLVEPVMWVTVIVLPLGLLLWVQIRFLPFHDETITWFQRAAVVIDVIMLWCFWPRIVGTDEKTWRWLLRVVTWPFFWTLVLWAFVRATAEVTILLCKSRFSEALTVRPWLIEPAIQFRRARGLVCLTFIGGTGILLSGLVAVLPAAGMEQWAARTAPESWKAKGKKGCREEYLMVTCWLFDRPRAPFHRNLRLEGKTLVAGEPSAEVLVKLRSEKEEVRLEARKKVLGFNLANRDLRSADFRNTVLPKADLRGANLDSADLRGADLTATDFRPFDVTDGGTCVLDAPPQALIKDEQLRAGIEPPRENGKFCLTSLRGAKLNGAFVSKARMNMAQLQDADLIKAQLKGATLSDAQLQGADLSGAQLQGADLSVAQLQGADLVNAVLQGADLRQAQLQGANLLQARLQGANLSKTRLQGADLTAAQLQGADLREAWLQGADLSEAQLEGANLFRAQLQGADLSGAQLQGADLSEAQLQGADLRGAEVGGAQFASVDLSFSDLREVDRKPLTDKEYGELEESLAKEVGDETLRKRILDTLKQSIDRLDNLEDAKAADNVLCYTFWLLPGKRCPSKQTVAEYDKSLVDKVLDPLACDDEADPAIALGLARRAISAGSVRPLGLLLAEVLLDPKCKGGAALAEETKAELKRIMRRR